VALRITRLGSSVSLLGRYGRLAYACDRPDAAHVRAHAHRWCGTVGKLMHGTLLDPRLDLCAGDGGRLVAFAWVQPLPQARWIVIRDGRLADVYPTAAGIPVRVTTTHGIDLRGSSERVRVAQYDRHGRLLDDAELEASVSG
jgi:hypothetical protein